MHPPSTIWLPARPPAYKVAPSAAAPPDQAGRALGRRAGCTAGSPYAASPTVLSAAPRRLCPELARRCTVGIYIPCKSSVWQAYKFLVPPRVRSFNRSVFLSLCHSVLLQQLLGGAVVPPFSHRCHVLGTALGHRPPESVAG